ncbi:unnamed protein product [Anisakis simplex]|uniref:Cullin-5 (inferred by orthology to a C. elegans protein) n=1 Tax=Anisakis simplex TaxID=6269 RepID=A0A0M3JL81_ANISI|nr:unnamed protein product [Anisakis simplex]
MLEDWNITIFQGIKDKLQNAAMKLVEAERNGEAFDPQLVIGVRQSYGKEYRLRCCSFDSVCKKTALIRLNYCANTYFCMCY